MPENHKELSSGIKILLITAGFVSLILGLIGIIVPLLPTTPFLLLSAACFFRGSDRLYNWLINHKTLGRYIRNFREHKAISLNTKIVSISFLWITMLFSIIFVVNSNYIRLLLAIILITVTAHILHFKTQKNNID